MYYPHNLRIQSVLCTRNATLLLALFVLGLPCRGQSSRFDSPTGVALSGVTVALEDDVWLGAVNAAYIPKADSFIIAAAMMQPTIGLANVGLATLVVVPPSTAAFRFCGAARAIVVGPYSDIELSGSVATDPSVDIAVGATFALRAVAVEAYPMLACGTIGLGGRLRVNDAIEVALSLTNIARATVGDLPPNTSIGLDLTSRLSPQTAMGISLAHESDRGARAGLGVVTDAIEGCRLRGGVTSDPLGVSFGGSIATASVGYDIGASWTIPLGVRTAIGIRIGIGELR